MWMMLTGTWKDQVSWQSLQCMLWAGSAGPGVCGEGEHLGVLQLEQRSSLQDIPPALHGWKGTGNQVLGPALMMRIYFPLSQAWVVSNVQKGRQCYVWEGQHFQSRIWCNGNYPKLFLLACSKISSQSCTAVSTLLYIHMVCPGLYLSSRDWEMPGLSPVKFSHCYE